MVVKQAAGECCHDRLEPEPGRRSSGGEGERKRGACNQASCTLGVPDERRPMRVSVVRVAVGKVEDVDVNADADEGAAADMYPGSGPGGEAMGGGLMVMMKKMRMMMY